MKQEKKYVEPKAEIIGFKKEDIIVTSSGVGGDDIGGIPGEDE